MPRESADAFLKELDRFPDKKAYLALIEIEEHIADNIAQQRDFCGLSQTQLAKLAGVKLKTIKRLEGATCPKTLLQVAKIAVALNVPMQVLLRKHK